jgi:hypothetical protein
MAKKNAAKEAAQELKDTIANAGGGSISIGDTTVEIPAADVKPEKPSAEIIAKVIADTVDEITRFMPRLRSSEEENDDAAKAAKDAKKTMEGNHLHLSMLCRRLADAKNGNYQPPLPFGKSDSLEDVGGEMNVGVLTDHGLTDKMVETLWDHEIETIGQLEETIASDEWWHRKIKGFGEERVTKLIDALVAFRAEHPIPSADEAELEE